MTRFNTLFLFALLTCTSLRAQEWLNNLTNMVNNQKDYAGALVEIKRIQAKPPAGFTQDQRYSVAIFKAICLCQTGNKDGKGLALIDALLTKHLSSSQKLYLQSARSKCGVVASTPKPGSQPLLLPAHKPAGGAPVGVSDTASMPTH